MTREKRNKAVLAPPLRLHRKLTGDLHDLAVVAERRSEKAVSIREVKGRLMQDGLL